MEEAQEISIMGLRIKRPTFPASPAFENGAACEYKKRGFCDVCTCEKCENGFLIEEFRAALRQGCSTTSPRECNCVRQARNRKHIRDSGLERLVERCSFDTFRTGSAWQATVKNKALDYLAERKVNSFFISGQSGSGKTHICTAICNEIMKTGARLRYFQWVRDGTRLKQIISDADQYERDLKPWIECPYLYADDVFKQDISAADIRLFYELLNARYIAGRPIIISSERSLSFIRAARGGEGEAIAGRVFEMAGKGKYVIELSGADKNQRFIL